RDVGAGDVPAHGHGADEAGADRVGVLAAPARDHVGPQVAAGLDGDLVDAAGHGHRADRITHRDAGVAHRGGLDVAHGVESAELGLVHGAAHRERAQVTVHVDEAGIHAGDGDGRARLDVDPGLAELVGGPVVPPDLD